MTEHEQIEMLEKRIKVLENRVNYLYDEMRHTTKAEDVKIKISKEVCKPAVSKWGEQ